MYIYIERYITEYRAARASNPTHASLDLPAARSRASRLEDGDGHREGAAHRRAEGGGADDGAAREEGALRLGSAKTSAAEQNPRHTHRRCFALFCGSKKTNLGSKSGKSGNRDGVFGSS